MFSEQELAFLSTQPLARLATVAVTGQPDADAVGFAFENGHFSIHIKDAFLDGSYAQHQGFHDIRIGSTLCQQAQAGCPARAC